MVFFIQEHLLFLGYEPGEIDGKLGLKTTLAIKAFQLDNKLDVDGLVTEELLIYLASALRKHRQG